jgi:hypothetical protein
LSTDGSPAARRTAVFAVAVAALATPALAAQVDFRPVLTFGVYHDGNVQIIGTDTVGEDSAAIAVDLAVDRATASSDFSFLYQATYVGYRQNSGLNYMGNLISASYTKELSRRSQMQAGGGVSRTDSQGLARSTVDPQGADSSNVDRPLTFVPRTTIMRGYGSVSGSVGVAHRSLVDWAVRAGVNRFDQVEGVAFNNSTYAGVLGGWRYELSELTTLGVAVDVGWFGFAGTANSVGESVVLNGTHAFGRFTSMTFNVGATRTTTGDFSSTNGTLLVSLSRALSENSRLNAGVRQSVSSGTGLQAATNDSGAWVSYAQSSPRNGLSWALDGADWYRKAIPAPDVTSTSTGTLNVAGALGWRFSRYLSLSAAYAYSYQNDQSDSSSGLDTSYASYGVFLRWTIRGETETSTDTGSRIPGRH